MSGASLEEALEGSARRDGGPSMTAEKKGELIVREWNAQRDDLTKFITAFNTHYGADPKKKQTS
jgi:hypothetical protein